MPARDPLEPLRQLRGLEVQRSASSLANALAESLEGQRALATADASVRAAHEAVERANVELAALAAAGARAGTLVVAAAYAERRGRALAEAQKDAAAALERHSRGERELDAARAQWGAARAREKLIERLRERRATSGRQARERREP